MTTSKILIAEDVQPGAAKLSRLGCATAVARPIAAGQLLDAVCDVPGHSSEYPGRP